MTQGFLRRFLPRVRASLADLAPEGSSGGPGSGRPSSFRRALGRDPRGRASVVVEYKRRAPASGRRRVSSAEPEDLVRVAASGDANAVSVLATVPGFGGGPEDVRRAAHPRRLPVLWKDFVIDARQVYAAHWAGASAILLIARLETEHLLDLRLRSLADLARSLGLEVVVEVHRSKEWPLARRLDADVYGVNQRDLDTLELRPEEARRSLRAAEGLRPLLGMSGIRGPEDARPLLRNGATALLVGTAVGRSADPRALISDLRALPLGSGG